ncbi:16636_t:CDS:2, partial [Acaulospora morrowiae]
MFQEAGRTTTEGGIGNTPLETTVGKLSQTIQELVAKFTILESAPRKRNEISNGACFTCGRKGHYVKDCPTARKNINFRNNRDEQPSRQTDAQNPQTHRDKQPATQTEARFGELISNEGEEKAFIGVNQYQPYNTRNQNNTKRDQEAPRNEKNEVIQPRVVIETTDVEELPTPTDKLEEITIEDKINSIEVSNEVKSEQKRRIQNLLLQRKD